MLWRLRCADHSVLAMLLVRVGEIVGLVFVSSMASGGRVSEAVLDP
jgi:hypothetical protein